MRPGHWPGQEKEMVSSTDKLYEPRGLAGSCLHSANHIYPVRSFLSIFFSPPEEYDFQVRTRDTAAIIIGVNLAKSA